MSYTCLLTHIVFSTKNRYPFLHDKHFRSDTHAYLGGIVRALQGKAYTIGGVADHVHLLVSLPPTLAISDAIRTIKSRSSVWAHETWRDISKFAWQPEYAAFSVSQSNVQNVAAYIDSQEDHHRTKTFQEEIEELLERHGIPFEERYIRR